MKAIAFLIATALATVIVLFSTRNPGVVVIDLIVLKVKMSLSVALLGAGLLGMLAGGFLAAALKRQLPAKEAGMKKLQKYRHDYNGHRREIPYAQAQNHPHHPRGRPPADAAVPVVPAGPR